MNRLAWIKKQGGLLLIIFLSIVMYRLVENFEVIQNLVKNILSVFAPVFIGAILAYFLSPLVIGLENILKQQKGFLYTSRRGISVLVVFFGFIGISVLFITTIAPIVISTLVDVAAQMSGYVINFEENARAVISNPDLLNFVMEGQKKLTDMISTFASTDPMVYIKSVFSVAGTALTIIVGLTFCPYILIERDRFYVLFKNIAGLFIDDEKLASIHNYALKSHLIFGKFIYGKFIDSLIIGLIAAVGFWILRLEAVPLLAFVIFVTNIIPYFGPIIGAVPVVLFVLLTGDIMDAVWTLLFILGLQQFDGLFLGPAILGETIGISPFWIIFAVTIFGGLWGFVGMFLGVPCICVVRVLYHDYMDYRNGLKQNE